MLCKFCSQSQGNWCHYTTCPFRPKQLVDLEARVFFESSVTLEGLILDVGFKSWIDKLYEAESIVPLKRVVTSSLRTVREYFRVLEPLLFSKQQKKSLREETHKAMKQLKIGDYFPSSNASGGSLIM